MATPGAPFYSHDPRSAGPASNGRHAGNSGSSVEPARSYDRPGAAPAPRGPYNPPPAGGPAMKEWYIYQADGHHVGPVPSDMLARGVAGGKVPRDAHIGQVGDAQWVPLMSV